MLLLPFLIRLSFFWWICRKVVKNFGCFFTSTCLWTGTHLHLCVYLIGDREMEERIGGVEREIHCWCATVCCVSFALCVSFIIIISSDPWQNIYDKIYINNDECVFCANVYLVRSMAMMRWHKRRTATRGPIHIIPVHACQCIHTCEDHDNV